MTTNYVLTPKKSKAQRPENSFTWKFGSNPETTATDTVFTRNEYPPGEKTWLISGSTGTQESEDIFSYAFAIPRTDGAPFKKTFTLEDGLQFWHGHSIPAPGGFYGYRTVDADEATITIDIDPARGTAKGTFKAAFKSHGYRPQPEGTFNLLIDI